MMGIITQEIHQVILDLGTKMADYQVGTQVLLNPGIMILVPDCLRSQHPHLFPEMLSGFLDIFLG